MKRLYSIIFVVFFCFAFTACSKKTDPIILPDIDDIVSINVTAGDETDSYDDTEWINNFISQILASEPTRKQSIQDMPQVPNYIKIDIQLTSGVRTLFIYEEDEKYYVEQPYQGIYEIDSTLFNSISTETDD